MILYSERLKRHYVGSTNDLVDRLKRHNNGEGYLPKKEFRGYLFGKLNAIQG